MRVSGNLELHQSFERLNACAALNGGAYKLEQHVWLLCVLW
jgi:hypothetical protein